MRQIISIIWIVIIFFITGCEMEDEYNPKPNTTGLVVTVFLYENCPIAQYMCGPLRNSYRYFCDTLNQEIIFRQNNLIIKITQIFP